MRRIEHRSEIHCNKPRYLVEGTEVARLRRRFPCVLLQGLLFPKRHYLCRQGVALAGTQQLRLQGPVPVYVHCTEGLPRSEGQEKGTETAPGSGGRTETETGLGTGTESGTAMGTGTGKNRERGRE